jgi:hypothetical protein
MTRKRLGWLALGGLILAGTLFGLGQWIGNWFWHPEGICSGSAGMVQQCKGYNFWSGIGADIGEITLIVSIISGVLWFRRHYQCHEETCSKIGMHHVRGTPFRTCWHHHPVLSQHPRGKVSFAHIQEAHAAAAAGGDAASAQMPDAADTPAAPIAT